MTAIIVDDEEHCCEVLHSLIKKYCTDVQVVTFCFSGRDAIALLQKQKIDIIFLDIEMPGMNGFEFLEQCPVSNFEIIFTTAYNEYAIRAIRHSALDYLLKPVDKDELIQAVNRAKEQKSLKASLRIQKLLDMLDAKQKSKRIALPTSEGLVMINTDDIMYCKGEGPYCNFYFSNNKTLLISKTLKEAEEVLQSNNFCRIHNSYLVNLACIQKYIRGEGGEVILNNGVSLPVSRTRKQDFMQWLERL
jgi:two-component system LytT family response regulator